MFFIVCVQSHVALWPQHPEPTPAPLPSSPWSPWRTDGIQLRRRWPACLPLSCSCTAVGAREWVDGSERPTPSALYPHFYHPWTSSRAPPADWRRHTLWSRPARRRDTNVEMETVWQRQLTKGWGPKDWESYTQRFKWFACGFAALLLFACELCGAYLTVVYWIMTLFSSSGLKSVFFCSVAKICFICPTMQFSVLCVCDKKNRNSIQTVHCYIIWERFVASPEHTDLSIPVSSFTSICSITSFFFCRHSANFGDELEGQI